MYSKDSGGDFGQAAVASASTPSTHISSQQQAAGPTFHFYYDLLFCDEVFDSLIGYSRKAAHSPWQAWVKVSLCQ